ncbi:MAG: glycosyltransferase [Bacteroidia bacterium]
MKLMILTSRFPYPLEKGDKLRMYHLIKGISRYHEVVLCALTDQQVTGDHLEALKPFCKNIHVFPLRRADIILNLIRSVFQRQPFQTGYFFRKKIKKEINQVFENESPDVVFCQLIRMYRYTEGWKIPMLLDYMDCFSIGMHRRADQSPPWFRPFFRWEARRLARAEAIAAHMFSARTIISEQDRLLLPKTAQADTDILPNGIDTGFFSRNYQETSADCEVVFVGNLGYFPNVAAARFLVQKVMPQVWKQNPGARVLLAGARPSGEVMALGSDPRVSVSGWVDDIRSAYIRGKVFAAPLFSGSGQQNKILEAMAMGLPCITTPLVNNAIGAAQNTEILLADTAEGFAAGILKLIGDKQLHQSVSENGVSFVRDRFSWETSVEKLDELLKQSCHAFI